MFEGLKSGLRNLFGRGDSPSGAPVQESTTPNPVTILRPWEDSALAPEARLAAYKEFVAAKVQGIKDSMLRAQGDSARQQAIMTDSDTLHWMEEGRNLANCAPQQFMERMERQMLPQLLGRNFLGAKAWKAQGIDVGQEPPIPAAITKALLESECPLHPGQKIKDTHLLVLVPKTVNGEPYTALELDALCATRKGSGDKLIYDGESWATRWKTQSWANTPQVQSEWVLIPKSDPDPKKVPVDQHFRSKNLAAQQRVHDTHYGEYREVKTLELMTAVLLNDLVNGEPRMLEGGNYLRCVEPNASVGRVCVGSFAANGLKVYDNCDDYVVNVIDDIGRALARK